MVDGVGLERLLLVEIPESGEVGVPEQGVVVDIQLGVEGDGPPVVGQDEGVDLDQRGVRLVVSSRERPDGLNRRGQGVPSNVEPES